MNNDLEQFSEERLKKICDFTKGGADVLHVEIEALARIALSVKQAKPVAWEVKGILCHTKEEANIFIGEPEPLYDNPQPAHTEQGIPQWTNEQCLEFLSVAFRHNDIYGEISVEDIRLGVKFALAAAPKPESE